MPEEIQLLQFLICKDFREGGHDSYSAEGVFSNYFVPEFPCHLEKLFAVTCWRKDKRFHKEVIEFETEDGSKFKSAHTDIEPVTSSVHYRWHKHPFPKDLVVTKPSILTIRVVLDWKTLWETSILIEKAH